MTTCPSLSTRSIVAVGKYGRIKRNDLTRYLQAQGRTGSEWWGGQAASGGGGQAVSGGEGRQ